MVIIASVINSLTRIGLLTCLIFCLVFGGLQADVFATAPAQNLEVLILHSYNIDFLWTQDQHRAFTETLESLGLNSTYSVELFDTKKYPGLIQNKMFVDAIIAKYGNQRYDLIYVTDNDAFNFMLKYAGDYFPDTPIVASGINGATDLTGLPPNFYLVLEQPDFQQTINQMLEVQPDIKRIHIVNDKSTTGKIFKAQIEAELIPLYPELTWHWVEALGVDAMKNYVRDLTPQDGLMLNIYFTDSASDTFTDREIVRLLSKESPVPVWCNWDFHLDAGAIGGHLVRGTKQGERAAQVAFDLIGGKTVNMQKVDTRYLNENMLDYQVLVDHGLQEKKVTFNPMYINKPRSYFQENRVILLIFSGIVSVLLLIIVILIRVVHDERQLKQKNEELLLIKQEVILNQKEIVFKMSELIENRSHDTGNHVRRVALISRLLAEYYGLSDHDIQELESAAPMHDVGKIGIPESVLNKPARLSTDERQVMETHTDLGYQIFRNSELTIFKAAGIISLQHHEHWDGKGYPLGIAEETIHIYGRIVAIADVFDALLAKRAYKEPWTIEETCRFLEQQSGKMFEPKLVSLVLENLDVLVEVRERYKD